MQKDGINWKLVCKWRTSLPSFHIASKTGSKIQNSKFSSRAIAVWCLCFISEPTHTMWCTNCFSTSCCYFIFSQIKLEIRRRCSLNIHRRKIPPTKLPITHIWNSMLMTLRNKIKLIHFSYYIAHSRVVCRALRERWKRKKHCGGA